MTFEEYLSSKKIDNKLFKEGNPKSWEEWDKFFKAAGEVSFTQQKLFLINNVRRLYPLKAEVSEVTKDVVAKPKPVIKVGGSKKPMAAPIVKNDTEAKPIIKKPSMKPVIKKPSLSSGDKLKPVIKPKVVIPKPKKD